MSASQTTLAAHLLLFLLTSCATTPRSTHMREVAGCGNSQDATTVCSSYHAAVTNMFVALARGDMAATMYYLSTVTGLSVTQQQTIINSLTHLFDEGNQIPGKCGDVAREGLQVLNRIGGYTGLRPYFLKIVPTDGEVLGFMVRGGSVKQVSDNGVHVAVKFAGRVFDAYTGPGGMEEKDYLKHFYTFYGQQIATKEYHSFPSMFQGLE
jgi:hypothetical protein